MPRNGGVGYLAVLLVALAIISIASVNNKFFYTPDGVVYARYAARDSGLSQRDATLAARAFYEHTRLMKSARYRALIELDPSVAFERSRIFANRPLYPALVSLLLPWAGFRALFLVSEIAYVAFGLALYWMLTALGSRYAAFGLTVLALASPIARAMAESDLTDMLALCFWTVWLAALMRSLRGGTRSELLGVLGLSACLLVLTRPALYLLAVPAVVAAVAGGARLELAASAVSAALFLIVTFEVHAFGVIEQLRWMHENIPGASALPFGIWYRTAVVEMLLAALSSAVRTIAPFVAIVCAVYAFLGGERRDVFVLSAAFIACLLPIPFNPVANQVGRIVGLTLLPVLCAMIQLAAQRFLSERAALAAAGTRAA